MFPKKIQARHYILGALAILTTAIVATSTVSIMLLRDREVESWRSQLSNLSLMLAEQTSQTMISSEMALDGIAERVNALGAKKDSELRARIKTKAFYQILRDKISGLPQVDVATIVAANGDVINFTRSFPAPAINLSDRDYFKAQLNNPASSLFVSIPVQSKATGKWVFYLSRRLNNASGSFMGLVLIGISVDQFTDFYEQLGKSLGTDAAITLYRRDFSVLTRWPFRNEIVGNQNLTGISHMVVEEMNKTDAVIYSRGPRLFVAGMSVGRLGAVRVLERFPMMVSLTVTEEFFLANWRRTLKTIVMTGTASVLALVVAAIFLLRIARQKEQSVVLLSNLTDQVPGMLFQYRLFPDGHSSFSYANKAFLDMYGLDPEDMPVDGSAIFAFQHSEDAGLLAASIQDSAHSMEPWHLDYRLVLPDKGIVWRHGDAQPQKMEDGSVLWYGYIADITERKESELALQKESEKNLALLHNASDGIHILDSDGKIIEVSDSFCAMLGYTREEVIGMHVSQWDAGFSAAELTSIIKKQFVATNRSEFETRHRRKDGTVFDVQISGVILVLGEKPVLFNSSRDITERKQIERERAESLDRLRKIASRVPGVVYQFLLRPDGSSCFPFASEAIRQIYRVTPEEVREDASKVFAILHPDDFDGIVASIQKSAQELASWRYEYRVKFEDGTVRWLLGDALPDRQEDGSTLWTGYISDVSERKQAESQHLESERRLLAILNVSPIAVRIATRNGRKVVFYNQAYCDLINNIDALDEDPKKYYVREQDYEEVMTTLAQGNSIINRQVELRIPNGPHAWVLASYMPMQYQGEDAVLGWFYDITDRKTLETELRVIAIELERANAQVEEERARLAERVTERTAQLLFANHAKDSFLATMSHEIRTPLGGLMGMMELLEHSQLDDKQREMLEAARNSGKSLLRIVNDILDWSKIEAGKLELSPHTASIAEMLKGVASTYTQIASEKDIALKVDIDPELSERHLFDPLRLSQILNNFTSNAVKFTQQGSIEISARLYAGQPGYETVRFSVRDSGVGIDQEQQSRLFKYYEQATADTARMYGGTGLGLAICRRLAELMDGTLNVDSTTGVGSTFSFTVNLPVVGLAVKHNSHTSPTEPLIGRLVTNGQRISILIVDDHPLNRMLLKQQLGMLGVQVEAAAGGVEALALWQTQPSFDLVISDCHMPEMDGYELTYRIRDLEQQAGAKRTPIIAWTANVLAEEEERCHKAGMDDLLTKPTELADLRAMLLKWLLKTGVLVMLK